MKTATWLILGGIAALWWFSRRSGKLAGLAGDPDRKEDLLMAAANLVALEEHLGATAAQTRDAAVIGQLNRVRKQRQDAMRLLLPNGAPGESWCALKHALCATKRLSETATKYAQQGQTANAMRLFGMAEDMKGQALALCEPGTGLNGPMACGCQGG